jgi:heat shock protein HtpX
MDLFAQQARNRRVTVLLMAVFLLIFLVLGGALDMLYSGQSGLEVSGVPLPLPFYSALSLGAGALGAVTSYFGGEAIVLKSVGARAIDESRLEERQFKNVVEEMAIASGMPLPKIYVLPEADPNAFATGRSPEHASLAVTEGLLAALDREELQAVVAHEMGHIRNLDIRTMTIVSVLLGAIALLSDLALRTSGYSHRRRSNREGGGNPLLLIAVLLLALLAPLASRMIAMAVSRTREYEADRSGAEFTRNPLALARALEKLEAHQHPTRLATEGTAHLFIVDPRLSKLNEREGKVASLFATHPPIRQRIARLERMGYGASGTGSASFRRKPS